jgi:hypothetical protein
MNLIQRVQAIVLKPRETWPVIEGEAATTESLYKNYIAPLAAVPAVAGFIGMSLIGVGGAVSLRVPIVSGLVNMVVGYVLTLAMVYVMALVADALAPRFGGQRNRIAALKLMAYGATAGFLGGLFSLLPALGVLGILAGLYSFYLVYTGLPVMMKCPPERALGYTGLLILCGMVAGILIGVVTATITPSPTRSVLGGLGGSESGAPVTVRVPGTDIQVNTGKLEEAARRIEQAQARGDEQAAAAAATAMIGAAVGALGAGAGSAQIDPEAPALAPEQLSSHLPQALAGLQRSSLSSQGRALMGISLNEAQASFEGQDGRRIEVTITDHGGMGRIAANAWIQRSLQREDSEEGERIYRKGARGFHETWRKDGSEASLKVALENGVQIELKGYGMGVEDLHGALLGLDPERLAKTAGPR